MTGKKNVGEDEEKWEGVINGGERENSLCPSVHCDQQEGESSSLSLLLPKVKGQGGGLSLPGKTELFGDTNLKVEEEEIILERSGRPLM